MFIENIYREQELYNQDESIGMRYINRMAIDEDDQFEIAAVDTLVNDDLEKYDDPNQVWYQETIFQEKMNTAVQAAKNLEELRNKEQKEGTNNIHLSFFIKCFSSFISCMKRDDYSL